MKLDGELARHAGSQRLRAAVSLRVGTGYRDAGEVQRRVAVVRINQCVGRSGGSYRDRPELGRVVDRRTISLLQNQRRQRWPGEIERIQRVMGVRVPRCQWRKIESLF